MLPRDIALKEGEGLFISRDQVLRKLPPFGNMTVDGLIREIWHYKHRAGLLWRLVNFLRGTDWWPALIKSLTGISEVNFGQGRFDPYPARVHFNTQDIGLFSMVYSSMDHNGEINPLVANLYFDAYWEAKIRKALITAPPQIEKAWNLYTRAVKTGLGELGPISLAGPITRKQITAMIYLAVFPFGKEELQERQYEALCKCFAPKPAFAKKRANKP